MSKGAEGNNLRIHFYRLLTDVESEELLACIVHGMCKEFEESRNVTACYF